jgi:D-beta-D-heptose 7-phosphate kinase/D-beta-D-heptose 1-phosphate adenosyltransferase
MRHESLVHLLKGFHGARVLVFGDVMLDRFVYGTVERISPEAPIPVVRVDRQADMPGGAANVARNIADLGANAVLIGVVGEDAFAADLRGQLAKIPTIQARLITDDSRPTSVKTRYVADGQQVMRADRESCAPVGPSVAERLLENYSTQVDQADLVVISDYAKGVLSADLTRRVIDLARARGKRIIVDPKSKDFSKYRGATLITPNRQELQQAAGEECVLDEHVVAAGSRIIEREICEFLVVTRGKDGMSVIGREGVATHLPTTARQVFDVSGAGDTVVAALALSLIAGGDVIEAAGIVVSKRGTATVSPGEIVATLSSSDGRTDPMKIFTLESVLDLVRHWRAEGLKIAFTNGCFDLVHPGHISLLNQARRTADRLVVGVNADISISRLKGPDRPAQGEVARATVLAAIKSVDAVVIFAEDTPLQLIDMLSPDVLVKGADYTVDTVVGADLVRGRGGKVVLAELLRGHSTTDTVKRVAKSPA